MRPLRLTAIAYDNKILTSRLSATCDADGAGIGRADGNLLILPDEASRVIERHAVLHHEDGWHIENLGPAASVALNDRPLAAGERAGVAPGDRIAVGPYTLLASDAAPANWNLAPAAPSPEPVATAKESTLTSLAGTALPDLLDLPSDPLLLFAQQDGVNRTLLSGPDDPMGMPGLAEFGAPLFAERSGGLKSEYSRTASLDDGAMHYDSHFGSLHPYEGDAPASSSPSPSPSPSTSPSPSSRNIEANADVRGVPAELSRWIELARALAAGGGWQAEQALPPARLTPELMHTVGSLLRYLEFRTRGDLQ
ncbi:FHA domain-containing protein [Caballeronia sp. LZ034LL]|uniref:FHA domain-containing protein n=1 Tax=Caballeronia sp. LZ034LL TaxID=3038567 RepID=UPI002855C6DE|nr:FHA domain-containing protein [Caballeronia sp. LZ034LL]MDR5836411.1 FHA domain-containing protein [Caballeronia sp. LZ034LL]